MWSSPMSLPPVLSKMGWVCEHNGCHTGVALLNMGCSANNAYCKALQSLFSRAQCCFSLTYPAGPEQVLGMMSRPASWRLFPYKTLKQDAPTYWVKLRERIMFSFKWKERRWCMGKLRELECTAYFPLRNTIALLLFPWGLSPCSSSWFITNSSTLPDP